MRTPSLIVRMLTLRQSRAMRLGAGVWLLAAVVCICVPCGESYTRSSGDNLSVTLPNWRTNSGYLTKCDFNDDLNPLCGWTSAGLLRTPNKEGDFHITLDNSAGGSPSGYGRLVSDVLNVSQGSCLEFWYLGHNATKLRVVQRDAETELGETLLWSSPDRDGSDTWRHVFIPLALSQDMSLQVVFEMTQGLPGDGGAAIDKVGIRKGQCGKQCDNGREFWTDESSRCVCSEGQLSCSHDTCPEGHTCGQPISTSTAPQISGLCVAHQEPRYTTFDNVHFRFVGPCTYVLAKTCGEGTSPAFSVEVTNELRGNASVSSVQQVNVNVQGVQVAMIRRELDRVMVNGIWQTLPFRFNGGASTVEQQRGGTEVVLKADSDLTVSYSATGEVRVIVAGHYAGKLCGMCGNFNHIKEDDFKRPDGTLAIDSAALGESWRDAEAWCEDPSLPAPCQGEEGLLYASEAYCGAMLSSSGPFAACSQALGADSFVASCVLDMCASQGDPEALCDSLSAYADTCRLAGAAVPIWRNSTFCPLVCGANSHYNACASGCPEVCSSLDSTAACGGECEERCECDDSFMLSAGRCVPREDCGCWVDGEHYARGERFMTNRCERLCQCMGQDQVLCSASSCSAHEVCRVTQGVMGCERSDRATCSVYGDPHYITFDGKAYGFHGNCNYTLAKTCSGSAPANFTVTTRNENSGRRTALNSVALEMDGLHILVTLDKQVFVNGKNVSLPVEPSTAVRVSVNDSSIHLETSFGLSLVFDGQHRLFLQVNERHRGQMCGLCGTYSGSQFDDFATPDGELLGRPEPFGDSWRVNDSDWTCATTVPVKPLCGPELQEDGFGECRKLYGEAFMACHMFVPPQIFVDSCVDDHCASDGNQGKLCAALESYVAACKIQGVHLKDWTAGTVCETVKPTPEVSTPPPPTTCPLACNFDSDECGWEQLVQDSFDWTRRSGPTPSDLTGPASDHTTGSGSYMYIEGDSAVHGDSARMLSPSCSVSGSHCLRFWYHMYGTSNAMALNIYLLTGNRAYKIWSRANNQGNSWQEAKVQIKALRPFQIILEGIRGSTLMSDVAVDDISIRFGECDDSVTSEPPSPGGNVSTTPVPSGNQTAPPIDQETTVFPMYPETTSPSPVNPETSVPPVHPETPAPSPGPAPVNPETSGSGLAPTSLPLMTTGKSGTTHPVCDLDCSFDNSLCSWDQLLTDSFDWTWHQGATPSLMTGPSSDHTSGGGHYLYVEGDGPSLGDTARILSGKCSDPGPQCLQFWYHMYGTADTMGLSVYLLEDRLAQGVWTKRNNQGDEWHKAEIDLFTTGPFQIILEGRRGSTKLSDVAVDDISLRRGSCADSVTLEPPSPGGNVSTTTAPPGNQTAPPVDQETTVFPIYPETTYPSPVDPETPVPPVHPETPAPPPIKPETTVVPPVYPETPGPVNPETSAPPVNPETPAPPVNPETPTPSVNPETPAPPVNPETPAPPINPETPSPPVNPETPAPPVNPETPAPPINPETPSPPVNPETPAPETPAPPVNPETPAPPVNPDTPAPPVNPETPAPPVNPETPAPPVNPETPAPTVNPETPSPPVNPETPAPPINPETPAPETPSPPVNPETPAPPVNPETPAPETPAPPVNPETPAPPVNPDTPAPPVNPETPAPPVNPETPAPPVNPETPAPPVNPETPSPPVNPETTAPPSINPETSAPPPVNPETSAPSTHKPTSATPQPTPSCPRNSHYTDCMPSCQPTCKHLHGSPHCDPNEPCIQGCVCNDGFVLKDRVCVPIQKCGCQDRKGQNHYFDEVWYTDHCAERCECEEDDGEGHIECDEEECDGDDVCYMDAEGEYTCKSTDFSECTIEDDPKYRTFDDMKHDFEGFHSYVLVQSMGLPKNLPDIYVEGINRRKSDQGGDSEEDRDSREKKNSEEEDSSEEHSDRGYPRELKIRVYNHTVEFKRNRKLYVDGVRTQPPVSPAPGLQVFHRSSRIFLKTDFGFSVEFDGNGKTEIVLPDLYKRRVGGLCGNFDGRKKNDLMKPDGSQAKGVQDFGESWRVTEEKLRIRWRRSARRWFTL